MSASESSFHISRTPLDRLSRRELQILNLASSGSTNGDIARDLGVSVHAVKFHLASVYRKLGVANRTEAAVALWRASADQVVVSAEEKSR